MKLSAISLSLVLFSALSLAEESKKITAPVVQKGPEESPAAPNSMLADTSSKPQKAKRKKSPLEVKGRAFQGTETGTVKSTVGSF